MYIGIDKDKCMNEECMKKTIRDTRVYWMEVSSACILYSLLRYAVEQKEKMFNHIFSQYICCDQ